jgi:hypothetical protein
MFRKLHIKYPLIICAIIIVGISGINTFLNKDHKHKKVYINYFKNNVLRGT